MTTWINSALVSVCVSMHQQCTLTSETEWYGRHCWVRIWGGKQNIPSYGSPRLGIFRGWDDLVLMLEANWAKSFRCWLQHIINSLILYEARLIKLIHWSGFSTTCRIIQIPELGVFISVKVSFCFSVDSSTFSGSENVFALETSVSKEDNCWTKK